MRKMVLETSCPVLLWKVEWRFQKQKKVKFCRRFSEVYSELNQASKTELFVKTINYLRKKLYLRCLTRFWMCFLFSSINSYENGMNILQIISMFLTHFMPLSLHKKWGFPLGISLVNVTKSAVSCGFGHIKWRDP